jgi:hypothetical protein
LRWKGALPPTVWKQGFRGKDPAESDFYIGIQEFIPRYKYQMGQFARHAGKHFVLAAPSHPEIQATLSGMMISYGDSDGRRYQLFGLRIDPEYRKFLVSGVGYTVRPINTSGTYAWTVKDGLVLTGPL